MAAWPDDRMVTVELVDDDGEGSSTRPAARPWRPMRGQEPAETGDVRPHGALTRWVAACVALGAVVVVTATATRPSADGEEGPGPLAYPLHEVWSTPADEVLGVHDGLVLVQSTGTREPRVRALDERTGDQVWSASIGSAGVADTCAGLTPDPPTVWCWRTPHWEPNPEDGRLAITPQGLVALDAATGEVRGFHEATEPTAGWHVVDEDLLLAARRDGVVTVRRVSPADWHEVWSTSLDLPGGLQRTHRPRVEVAEGFVVVRGPTTAVLDVADGAVLASWSVPADDATVLGAAEVAVTPHGFAAWTGVVEGARVAEGTWYDRDGTPAGEVSGRVLAASATDAAAPEVLLVSRDDGASLVATSVESGQDLWQVDLAGGAVATRADGVVVVTSGDEVSAYETLTGLRLWHHDVDGLHAGLGGVGDGSTVVVTAVRARRWTVLAYRLSDGALLWQGTVPGTGEIGLVPHPPTIELVGDVPVVRIGRTLVWLGR